MAQLKVVLANRVNTFARLERSVHFLDALSPDLMVEDACGTRLVTDTGVDLRDFRATLEHILERTNFETDLYVYGNLSMEI